MTFICAGAPASEVLLENGALGMAASSTGSLLQVPLSNVLTSLLKSSAGTLVDRNKIKPDTSLAQSIEVRFIFFIHGLYSEKYFGLFNSLKSPFNIFRLLSKVRF